jgi:hypothetical protein
MRCLANAEPLRASAILEQVDILAGGRSIEDPYISDCR